MESASDFTKELASLIKKTFKTHKRIIFNGNNYCNEWILEAKNRGLSNLSTTADALPKLITEKSIDLFTKHHVFSKEELHSRYEILMETYCKTINIESLTMLDIIKSEIIPACFNYQRDLVDLVRQKKALSGTVSAGNLEITPEDSLLGKISKLSSLLYKNLNDLENALLESKIDLDVTTQGCFYRDNILPVMASLRIIIDELETIVTRKYWPYPVYGKMLYSVI